MSVEEKQAWLRLLAYRVIEIKFPKYIMEFEADYSDYLLSFIGENRCWLNGKTVPGACRDCKTCSIGRDNCDVEPIRSWDIEQVAELLENCLRKGIIDSIDENMVYKEG